MWCAGSVDRPLATTCRGPWKALLQVGCGKFQRLLHLPARPLHSSAASTFVPSAPRGARPRAFWSAACRKLHIKQFIATHEAVFAAIRISLTSSCVGLTHRVSSGQQGPSRTRLVCARAGPGRSDTAWWRIGWPEAQYTHEVGMGLCFASARPLSTRQWARSLRQHAWLPQLSCTVWPKKKLLRER
jgi:hypothetical protein